MNEPSSQSSIPLQNGSADSMPSTDVKLDLGAEIPVHADPQKTVISSQPPYENSPKAIITSMNLGEELEGKQLDHFLLGEFVGGGGMGVVFRATDTQLGRTVAVKVIPREQDSEDVLRRFRNEAQSAARLDHPNIARVYYVGQDQGWNYIVFEFIEGVNLRDLVNREGPLSIDDAVFFTRQVVEALDHAAARDVVHRDIKPSNVLVTPEGRVKLVDMGLARLHQVETASNDLTASGVTLGTFDYISPEQARDPRTSDVRSDLYSLGCTLYFILTGVPPFPDGTVLQKLLSHSSEEPADPRQFREDLPEKLVAILQRMLAKSPDDRFQEPDELVGELLLLANELDLPRAKQGGAVWFTPRRDSISFVERQLPWVVPLAILIVLFFIVKQKSRSPAVEITRPQLTQDTSTTPATLIESENDRGANDDTTQQEPRDFELPIGSDPPPDSDANTKSSNDDSTTTTNIVELVTPVEPEDSNKGNDLSARPVNLPTEDPSNGDPKPSEPNGTVDKTKVILVGNSEGYATELPVRAVGSLGEAVRLAKQLPHLERIVLRKNLLIEQPFSFPADADVDVRAAVGYDPVVVFKPNSSVLLESPQMIFMAGGKIEWEGIHFRLELPLEVYGSCSLFHSNQVSRLNFRKCSLTIKNAGDEGEVGILDAAFFEVEGRPPSVAMPTDGTGMMTAHQAINLFDCVVRGEANLLRGQETTPFVLNWQTGLFVTTRRLLETAGSQYPPEKLDPLQIKLTGVTVRADQGLCYIDSSTTEHLLFVELDCDRCVLTTGAGYPLVEHVGAPNLESVNNNFLFKGMNNWYPNSSALKTVVWQISTKLATDAQEFYFDSVGDSWETEPHFDQPWIQAPPHIPVHLLTKDDFRLRDFQNEPGPDYDVSSLPEIPTPKPAPAAKDGGDSPLEPSR